MREELMKRASIDLVIAMKGFAIPRDIELAYNKLCKAIADADKHQVSQEPVVWMYQDKSTHKVYFQKNMRGFVDHDKTYETPIYANSPEIELNCVCGAVWEGNEMVHAPRKREWIGPTDKDIHECFMLTEFDHHVDFNRDPEQWCLAFAKELSNTLKQKNGYAEEKNNA